MNNIGGLCSFPGCPRMLFCSKPDCFVHCVCVNFRHFPYSLPCLSSSRKTDQTVLFRAFIPFLHVYPFWRLPAYSPNSYPSGITSATAKTSSIAARSRSRFRCFIFMVGLSIHYYNSSLFSVALKGMPRKYSPQVSLAISHYLQYPSFCDTSRRHHGHVAYQVW